MLNMRSYDQEFQIRLVNVSLSIQVFMLVCGLLDVLKTSWVTLVACSYSCFWCILIDMNFSTVPRLDSDLYFVTRRFAPSKYREDDSEWESERESKHHSTSQLWALEVSKCKLSRIWYGVQLDRTLQSISISNQQPLRLTRTIILLLVDDIWSSNQTVTDTTKANFYAIRVVARLLILSSESLSAERYPSCQPSKQPAMVSQHRQIISPD